MASTLVHVALAALLAAALLGRALDWRAAAVVLGATALVDLDTFLGLAVEGVHRAATHSFVVAASVGAVVAAVFYYDTRVRASSLVARRWPAAPRVAAVAFVAAVVAGIGLDMVINGVNAFWPLHDQFYAVNGKAVLSDQRGFVQTFVELQPPEQSTDSQPRTTQNTHYSTGVDPTRDGIDRDVERIFPLVRSGWQLLLVTVGYGVLGGRLWEERGGPDGRDGHGRADGQDGHGRRDGTQGAEEDKA